MPGKEILEQGLVWKVESGNTIDIWQDTWIPTKASFKVGEPRRRVEALERVSKLILFEVNRWNDDLIGGI